MHKKEETNIEKIGNSDEQSIKYVLFSQRRNNYRALNGTLVE